MTLKQGAAGAYLRVSTEEQRERQSIQTQREFATRYAALRGLTFAEEFLDDGISGTVPMEKRPGGAALLQAAASKRISTAYVYRVDRIGRDIRVILNGVYALEDSGCSVVSMTESFETVTPAGKAMLGMLAVFAGFERDSIAARTREGYHRAARTPSRWLGGPRPPYGYQVQGEGKEAVLFPDPEEAPTVTLIYSLAVQGWSTPRIVEYLTSLQIPPPSASLTNTYWVTRAEPSGRWHKSTVLRILRSPTYKGERFHGKRSGKLTEAQSVPPLVDARTWERAQIEVSALRNPRTRPIERIYLLRGLIRCADCGRTYHGWPQSERYFYYMCGGWQVKPKCAGRLLPAERYEAAVWRDVEALLYQNSAAVSLEGRQAEKEQWRVRERGLVQEQLEGKTRERERVLGAFRRGRLTDAELDAQLDAIQAEQDILLARWRELEGEEAPVDRARVLDEVRKELEGDLTPERKQRICRILIERIDLAPGQWERGLPGLVIRWRV